MLLEKKGTKRWKSCILDVVKGMMTNCMSPVVFSLHHAAIHCNKLQHTATLYSTHEEKKIWKILYTRHSMDAGLQLLMTLPVRNYEWNCLSHCHECIALCCNGLQWGAVGCSVLQRELSRGHKCPIHFDECVTVCCSEKKAEDKSVLSRVFCCSLLQRE